MLSLSSINAFGINMDSSNNELSYGKVTYADDLCLINKGGIATKTISTDSDVDLYEPNDFDNPYGFYKPLNSSSYCIETIEAVLSSDDTLDAYSIYTDSDVKEIVALIDGIAPGDKVYFCVYNDTTKEGAEGIVDGNNGSAAYINYPAIDSDVNHFTVYVGAYDLANNKLNYTLNIASRYNSSKIKYYATPKTLYNYDDSCYSSTAKIVVDSSSGIPRSAVADRILTQGNATSLEDGRAFAIDIKIDHGSSTLYAYSGPVKFIDNLSSQNIPLYGSWYISFIPRISEKFSFSNISLTFDYTYDILDV